MALPRTPLCRPTAAICPAPAIVRISHQAPTLPHIRRTLGGGRRACLLFFCAPSRKLPPSFAPSRCLQGGRPMLRFGSLALLLGALTVSPAPAQEKNPVVIVETSMGNFKVELFKDKAPVTVKNFLKYVEDEHY